MANLETVVKALAAMAIALSLASCGWSERFDTPFGGVGGSVYLGPRPAPTCPPNCPPAPY
jgi:hypothetical protein